MLCSTNTAASLAGNRRGVKRSPVEAVDTECPPRVAATVPRDQVPAAAVIDERVRLDLAAAVDALAAAIVEAEALGVAARRGDHREVLGLDRGAPDRERDRRRAERPHTPPQVRRQDLLELHQGSHGRLLDSRHRRACGGAQADRDRDCLLVVEEQRWHRASGPKPVPTRGAGERLDGIAEPAQALDVAPDRAATDLEPVGQLAARPVAAPLQQGEKLKKPSGRGHGN
jgi:hypothetical protein